MLYHFNFNLGRSLMNNNLNEELNLQVRKFLKQVGVTTHQEIEKNFKDDTISCNVVIKLEINNTEIQHFSVTLNK